MLKKQFLKDKQAIDMIKIHHCMRLQVLDYSASSTIREKNSRKEVILLILNPNTTKIYLCTSKKTILKMIVSNSKVEKKKSKDHNG